MQDHNISIKTSSTKEDDFCPERRKDQLCIAIRNIILEEKAYRNPSTNRDILIKHLGTNKDLFVDAFQYCFGMSFSECINDLRLKDTILLLEQSDLPIETISEKVGFGTVRTLQRQFRIKYNMSPKNYRKQLKENQNK
jgi:AraC-like DNA-binding protein